MIKGIYASGGGMQPRMARLEVLANNIANVNTAGFKKENLFIRAMNNVAQSDAKGEGELRGLEAKEFTDFSEGSFMQTQNPLDVAIQGRGFFVIETPQGLRYTRNGNFTLGVDGTVINGQGYPVLGLSGRIQIPQAKKLSETAISISAHGEISVGNKHLGRFRIADFEDLNQLKKSGNSLFATEAQERQATLDGHKTLIHQGHLEESNVDGIHEMIQLVELTRSFETDQRTLQAQDTTLERAMDIGRV